MNDNLVVYIEKEVFADVGNQDFIDMFDKMKTHRRPQSICSFIFNASEFVVFF